MKNDSPVIEDVVVRSGHSPDADGAWRPFFKAHRATCRYASTADPVGPFLDLWGRDHWAVMVLEGRVVGCKVCKPTLV